MSTTMQESKDRLIESLQKQLDFTERRLGEERKENFLLKRTVKTFLQTHLLPIPAEISLEVPEEPEQSWAEKSQRFKPLLQAIMEVVDNFVKETGHSAHYDDLTAVLSKHPRYRQLYAALKDPNGTISARCRDLRKWGYLESPEDAHFIPGPKRFNE